jgi:murein DD-endopeptidase MepM/ murein hydrolase activator NlpD
LANTGGDWHARFRDFARRVALARCAGTVNGPLAQAMRLAGGPAEVTYKMADVLRWDLDFNRDLRLGDRFEVLYEQVYLDDSNVGSGAVVALSYENRGQRHEAYRFEDAYYDGEGRPLQKMFLRSPLPFSRVTSRFSKRRFHPVLKVNRPHWGVDYGAPTGTPVRATAGGHVAFAGRKGGAGNMVELRHVAGYRTAYLHLSRFAKGVRAGSRVAQGEIVGYVGSTGLATAPHLDYRVKKDGRWIDPLSIQVTPAEPIPFSRLPAFHAARNELRRRLMALDTRDPLFRIPDATLVTADLEARVTASRRRVR